MITKPQKKLKTDTKNNQKNNQKSQSLFKKSNNIEKEKDNNNLQVQQKQQVQQTKVMSTQQDQGSKIGQKMGFPKQQSTRKLRQNINPITELSSEKKQGQKNKHDIIVVSDDEVIDSKVQEVQQKNQNNQKQSENIKKSKNVSLSQSPQKTNILLTKSKQKQQKNQISQQSTPKKNSSIQSSPQKKRKLSNNSQQQLNKNSQQSQQSDQSVIIEKVVYNDVSKINQQKQKNQNQNIIQNKTDNKKKNNNKKSNLKENDKQQILIKKIEEQNIEQLEPSQNILSSSVKKIEGAQIDFECEKNDEEILFLLQQQEKEKSTKKKNVNTIDKYFQSKNSNLKNQKNNKIFQNSQIEKIKNMIQETNFENIEKEQLIKVLQQEPEQLIFQIIEIIRKLIENQDKSPKLKTIIYIDLEDEQEVKINEENQNIEQQIEPNYQLHENLGKDLISNLCFNKNKNHYQGNMKEILELLYNYIKLLKNYFYNKDNLMQFIHKIYEWQIQYSEDKSIQQLILYVLHQILTYYQETLSYEGSQKIIQRIKKFNLEKFEASAINNLLTKIYDIIDAKSQNEDYKQKIPQQEQLKQSIQKQQSCDVQSKKKKKNSQDQDFIFSSYANQLDIEQEKQNFQQQMSQSQMLKQQNSEETANNMKQISESDKNEKLNKSSDNQLIYSSLQIIMDKEDDQTNINSQENNKKNIKNGNQNKNIDEEKLQQGSISQQQINQEQEQTDKQQQILIQQDQKQQQQQVQGKNSNTISKKRQKRRVRNLIEEEEEKIEQQEQIIIDKLNNKSFTENLKKTVEYQEAEQILEEHLQNEDLRNICLVAKEKNINYNEIQRILYNEEFYEPGDDVFIKGEDPSYNYIAKIVRIISIKLSKIIVAIEVNWYYKKNEINQKKYKKYMSIIGQNEVFRTQHQDFQSVEVLNGHINVLSFQEYDKLKEIEDGTFYTRADYNVIYESFKPPISQWGNQCVCRKPMNPDLLMTFCETCKTWYHLNCIKKKKNDVQKLDIFVCDQCQKTKNVTQDQLEKIKRRLKKEEEQDEKIRQQKILEKQLEKERKIKEICDQMEIDENEINMKIQKKIEQEKQNEEIRIKKENQIKQQQRIQKKSEKKEQQQQQQQKQIKQDMEIEEQKCKEIEDTENQEESKLQSTNTLELKDQNREQKEQSSSKQKKIELQQKQKELMQQKMIQKQEKQKQLEEEKEKQRLLRLERRKQRMEKQEEQYSNVVEILKEEYQKKKNEKELKYRQELAALNLKFKERKINSKTFAKQKSAIMQQYKQIGNFTPQIYNNNNNNNNNNNENTNTANKNQQNQYDNFTPNTNKNSNQNYTQQTSNLKQENQQDKQIDINGAQQNLNQQFENISNDKINNQNQKQKINDDDDINNDEKNQDITIEIENLQENEIQQK